MTEPREPGPFWPRAIALVDMNAFFAAIEQRDRPEWRARPVAITNGLQGTCIITSSYEARAYGVKTGMRLKQARRLCPDLIQCPARPRRYAEVSSAIMTALQGISPDVEVFSVDEAFLDISRCQRLLGTPEAIARRIKQTVLEASGLLCSVGVSGDKTTAKYAAKRNKPDGLSVIPPWRAEATLASLPVTELCGIAGGVGRFLAARGIHRCGEMKALPVSVLAERFGDVGRRIWLMCQGRDPAPVSLDVPPPRSIGHGKVMPPDTRDPEVILTFLLHMSEKVAARLRRHGMQARHFHIGLRTESGWLADRRVSEQAIDDSRPLMVLCRDFLRRHWRGQGVHQVQLTALDPAMGGLQPDLFRGQSNPHQALNSVMDEINHRYGEFALAPARLLQRSRMPNVIAPAWKPFGHRETIL